MVVLAVEPVIAPGLIVQVPAGKPFKTTDPVATAQVGCVISAVGAPGVPKLAVITTFADAEEIQPDASVTVKLYVPATKPVMVVLAVEPVIAPGLIVQLPAGKPLIITLPVANAQVGCVINPAKGAEGMALTISVAIFDVALFRPVQFVKYDRY
jgi:hypothetical protein